MAGPFTPTSFDSAKLRCSHCIQTEFACEFDRTAMRNLFDQYESPENRLTHALGCCLQRDPRLLREFITWATQRRVLPRGKLEVLEQQVPGTPREPALAGERGLPDLWIHGHDDWSLLVESKVQARILPDQLRRHQATARRNGFTDIDLIVLAPTLPVRGVRGVRYFEWSKVYAWMRHQAGRSDWAACMAEYLEVAEARMIEDGYLSDHSLTEFDGVPFNADHPYTYREAKRIIKLAFVELRKRNDLFILGMDPTGKGRSAITGSEGQYVWDFVPLKAARGKANFTAHPHLTMSIQMHRTLVIVTLPNGVSPGMRKNLTSLGVEGFGRLIAGVEAGVEKATRKIDGAYPFMEAVQRHYPSQRAMPIEDARLEFDLRTAVGSERSRIKPQPQWLEAAYWALAAKKSNLQLGLGAVLPYGDPKLHSRDVLDVIAGVWIGCKPWIDTILGR